MPMTYEELSKITGINSGSVKIAQGNVRTIVGEESVQGRLAVFGKASHTYFDEAQRRARKVAKELTPFGALGAGGLNGYVSDKKSSNDVYKQGKAIAAEKLKNVLNTLQQINESELSATVIEMFIKDLHEIRKELLTLTLAQREWFHTTSKGGRIAQIFDGNKYKILMQRLAEMYVFFKEKEAAEQGARQSLVRKYPAIKGNSDVSSQAVEVYERAKQRAQQIGKPLPSHTYVAKALDFDEWLANAWKKTHERRRAAEQKANDRAPEKAKDLPAWSKPTLQSPEMTNDLQRKEEKLLEERALRTGYGPKPQPLQAQMAGALDNAVVKQEKRFEKSGKGLAQCIAQQKTAEVRKISVEELLAEQKFERMVARHKVKVADQVAEAAIAQAKQEILADAKAETMRIRTFAATNSKSSSRLFSSTPSQTPSSSPSQSQPSSGGSPDKKHSPGSSPTP